MANFQVPEAPQWQSDIRKFETSDPAHADLFNAVVQILLNNEVFLYQSLQKTGNEILYGPPSTQLKPGETLFVVEGMTEPIDFRAASFSNVTFSADSPNNTEYWADTTGGAVITQFEKGTEVSILNGKLAVSTEDEVPEDTVFLANINSQKERKEQK